MSDINLTRGDTLTLEVTITDGNNEPYELQDGDKLTFTVKKSVFTEEILIQKEIVDGIFTISHDDTKDLSYGKYKYDVQLNCANGDVFTVIKPSNLNILEEVNYD